MKVSQIKEIVSEVVAEEMKEGVGYVYDKDRAKDPKSIPGERWRIKFQSAGDLKKHGNTEKSKVSEDMISYFSAEEKASAEKIFKTLKYWDFVKYLKQSKGNINRAAMLAAAGAASSSSEINKLATSIQPSDTFTIVLKKIYQTIRAVPNNFSRRNRNIYIYLFRLCKEEMEEIMKLNPKLIQREQISKNEVKDVIKELVDEMWIAWEQEEEIEKSDLRERKNMNKEDVRKLIGELVEEIKNEEYTSLQEVKFEDTDYKYQEQQEKLALKRIQSYAHWIKIHFKTHPSEIVGVIEKIVTEIDGLVTAHEKGEEVSPVNVVGESSSQNLKEVNGEEESNLPPHIMSPLKSTTRVSGGWSDIISRLTGGRKKGIRYFAPNAYGTMPLTTKTKDTKKFDPMIEKKVNEVAPPGWEGTVKAMKKYSVGGAKKWNPKKKKEEENVDVEEAKKKKKITNPYALAWWMKNQGYESHK